MEIIKKINERISLERKQINWEGSLWDYLSLVEKEPARHLRSSIQYISDSIKSFAGTKYEDCGETIVRYHIFDDPTGDGAHAIYGKDRELIDIIDNIETLAKGGGNERILLFKGPPGTGKSGIVNLLMRGIEAYSKTDGGACYCYEWVFPDEVNLSGIGYQLGSEINNKGESYAGLKRDDIQALIPCQMRDTPLVLIPKENRLEFLEAVLRKSGKKIYLPKKIVNAEPCLNCQKIFDALLDKYNQDIDKVYKHINVKRFSFSEFSQRGLATVISGSNPEGQTQFVVQKEAKEMLQLSKILRNIDIHFYLGEWVNANRGLIHFQDIFDSRSEISLKALRDAVEEHIVNLGGVLSFIDCFIIGTSNTLQYESFRGNQSNLGLRDRINSCDIGYLLNYMDEAKIYKKELIEAGFGFKRGDGNRHCSPYTLEMASIWAVLTRLSKPDKEYYREYHKKHNIKEELKQDEIEIASSLNPIQKARLYGGEIAQTLDLSKQSILKRKHLQKAIRNEFKGAEYNLKEGMFGISPRTMQDVFTSAFTDLKKGDCLNIYHIFKMIEQRLTSGTHVFLETENNFRQRNSSIALGAYRNSADLRLAVEREYRKLVAEKLKLAIIGMKDDGINNRLLSYLKHVIASVKKEQIIDDVSKKEVPPNERFMADVEKILHENHPETFRLGLIQRLGASASEGLKFHSDMIQDIFPEMFSKYKEGLYEATKESVSLSMAELKEGIEYLGTDKLHKKLPAKKVSFINRVVNSFREENEYGEEYCDRCAKDTILFILDQGLIR